MRVIHTMLRSRDLARTQAFLEALGFEHYRETEHNRNGVLEATNYFFRLPGDMVEVEVSVSTQGLVVDVGAWGHVALGVAELDAELTRLAALGIYPDAAPYRVRKNGPRLCLLTEPVEGHVFELVETG
jgi:catechol 2,3-dioxygenase-like lactoylglutathione lyase family enzyme